MNAAAIASLLQAMADLIEATDADIYTDDPDFAPAVWNLQACASQAKAELEKTKQENPMMNIEYSRDGGICFAEGYSIYRHDPAMCLRPNLYSIVARNTELARMQGATRVHVPALVDDFGNLVPHKGGVQ